MRDLRRKSCSGRDGQVGQTCRGSLVPLWVKQPTCQTIVPLRPQSGTVARWSSNANDLRHEIYRAAHRFLAQRRKNAHARLAGPGAFYRQITPVSAIHKPEAQAKVSHLSFACASGLCIAVSNPALESLTNLVAAGLESPTHMVGKGRAGFFTRFIYATQSLLFCYCASTAAVDTSSVCFPNYRHLGIWRWGNLEEVIRRVRGNNHVIKLEEGRSQRCSSYRGNATRAL